MRTRRDKQDFHSGCFSKARQQLRCYRVTPLSAWRVCSHYCGAGNETGRDRTTQTKRLEDAQILGVPKEAEAGVKTTELWSRQVRSQLLKPVQSAF